MKRILVLAIITVFALDAMAQYTKVVVRFTDKSSTPYSLSNPSQYLSPRAIARRARYNIATDSLDLPVVPRYIDSVLSKGPVTFLSSSKWLNQVLIQCSDGPTIDRIRALPFVASANTLGNRRTISTPKLEPVNQGYPLIERSTADNFDYGNNYNQVHIHEGEFLHNKGFNGQGMVIAVLDAGFNSYKTSPFFDSVRQQGRILGERDFVAFDNSVNEDDAHGFFCASIMCANYPGKMVGTAPRASYWLLRTENNASEFPVEEHNWVVGAEFADSSGADMISSSLGYMTFDDPAFDYSYNDFYKNTAMVTRGATAATNKGMIVMNSAGNEGTGAWKYIIFPADADSVCAVGAVDQLGNVVAFSSYGYPGKVKPNIASVGGGTVLAGFGNNTTTGSGTSYAQPNIAGLIACLWQAFPEFNNMQILDAVYRSCPQFNSPNDRTGFGIPNMRIAYELLEQQRGTMFTNNWMVPLPSPFVNASSFNIKIKAPETGKVAIRLLDASGKLVDKTELAVAQNSIYDVRFTRMGSLAKGVYFVEYIGNTLHQTIRIIRQ